MTHLICQSPNLATIGAMAGIPGHKPKSLLAIWGLTSFGNLIMHTVRQEVLFSKLTI